MTDAPHRADGDAKDDAGARLDRLAAAMEVFLRWCDRTEGSDRAAFLARHDDLRDLLEPMLDDAQDGPVEAKPAAVVLLPGRQVGDYRIVRELGRGGMGIVFEAEQLSLHRRVALKLLHPHLAWSSSSIERFRREAAIAASLRHPAIVPIHEVGEWRGLHFFSMEFVDGEPLSERVHKERLVDGPEPRARAAARLCAEVADALRDAHARGLVHRDVKPHNILLDRDGGVRLVDFGLAKDLAVVRGSATGSFVGTPHYCSPEQVAGRADLGPPSDVFALGIVLYELLARRRPFDAETTRLVLQHIERGDFEPLRRLAPSTPRDLETICHKALEPDAGARYPDAGAFADDLQRFLRIEPIRARPPGVVLRAAKWLRRHRARVALTGTLLLLLVGVPIGYALSEESQRRAIDRQRAAAEREREAADATAELGLQSVAQTLAMIHEQLEHLPEPPEEHRRGVDDAVRLYEEFLRLRPDDPRRQRRVAEALHQATFVYARLHLHDAALAVERRAIELLPVDGPAAALRERLTLRLCYLTEATAPAEEEETFTERTAEFRRAASAEEAPLAVRIEYVDLLLLRARRLADQGESLDQAERLTRHAQATVAFVEPSDDPERQRVALQADALLGQVILRRGQAAAALPVLTAARTALHAVTDRPHLAVDLAQVSIAIGEAHHQLGQTDAAEAALRAAFADAAPLLQQFPGAHSLRRACGRGRVKLAAILMAQRRFAEAEAVLEAAVVPLAVPGEGATGWLDRSQRASLVQQRAACILLAPDAAARRPLARALLTEATTLLEQVVAERPAMTSLRIECGAALSNLAAAHNEDGEHAAAADCARRAIAQQRTALQAQPDNRRAAVFFGIHHAQLALALAALGDWQAGVAAAEQAIEHSGRNPSTLRLAAEAAHRCAGTPEAGGAADRCDGVAVAALAKLATIDAAEARRWLDHPRFAALRERADFQDLHRSVAR